MKFGWLTSILVEKNEILISETRPKQEHEKIDNEGNEANGKAHYFIFNGVNLDKFHK